MKEGLCAGCEECACGAFDMRPRFVVRLCAKPVAAGHLHIPPPSPCLSRIVRISVGRMRYSGVDHAPYTSTDNHMRNGGQMVPGVRLRRASIPAVYWCSFPADFGFGASILCAPQRPSVFPEAFGFGGSLLFVSDGIR